MLAALWHRRHLVAADPGAAGGLAGGDARATDSRHITPRFAADSFIFGASPFRAWQRGGRWFESTAARSDLSSAKPDNVTVSPSEALSLDSLDHIRQAHPLAERPEDMPWRAGRKDVGGCVVCHPEMKP